MTQAIERTRALRLAGALMRQIEACEQVPDDLRADAQTVLRHYPDDYEIRLWAQSEGQHNGLLAWLEPE